MLPNLVQLNKFYTKAKNTEINPTDLINFKIHTPLAEIRIPNQKLPSWTKEQVTKQSTTKGK